MVIRSLRPALSEEEARRVLAPSGVSGWLQRWRKGPLLGLAAVYIPYRLYRIEIDDRGRKGTRYYAIDAAAGNLDPYEFAGPSGAEDLVEVTTRNALPSVVDEVSTCMLAIESIRRQVYLTGFFRLRNPSIAAEPAQAEFHVPYWVGFYGDPRNLSITVIEAVRKSIEGAKVRRVLSTWLAATGLPAQPVEP